MELLPLLTPPGRFSRAGLSKVGNGDTGQLILPWEPIACFGTA